MFAVAFGLFVFAALFALFAVFALLAFDGATIFAFVVFVFIVAFTFAALASTFELVVFASTFVLALVFAAGVSVEELVVERTETSPVIAGIANSKAESIKTIAALMVSLDKTVAVPRGPNALLETLLVKSAPASVLPG